MTRLLILALIGLPSLGLAAGGGGSTGGSTGTTTASPPTATETTTRCKGIQIWDAAKGACVNPRGSQLDPQDRMQAVRELAYAGRLEAAQAVLATLPDQEDDLVLTYWGFTHRKLGHVAQARAYYDRALNRNPDNLLARSYLGQGLIETGDFAAAAQQWREIVARGGTGTWAEASLRTALRTGLTYSY